MALDLVHTALSRAGYQSTTSIVENQSLTPKLENGSFDGSAALWRSPERESYLFYSRPYLENRLILVGRAGSDVGAESFGQLAGKRIGIVEGYAYGEALEATPEPSFVRGTSTEENLRALLREELDYVLADALLMHHVFQQYPEQANEKLAVGTTALIKRTLHLALQKSYPEAEAILARFDAEISRMLADGSFNKTLGVAWLRADVDGDGRSELVAYGPQAGALAPRSGYAPLTTTPAPPATPEHEHYYIEGKHYEGWDNVPDTYKTDPHEGNKLPEVMQFKVFEF